MNFATFKRVYVGDIYETLIHSSRSTAPQENTEKFPLRFWTNGKNSERGGHRSETDRPARQLDPLSKADSLVDIVN